MKQSISDELYSEITESSNDELDRRHIAVDLCETSHVNDGADAWHSDGSSFEDAHQESELDREWRKRHNEFHTLGYRDGLIAGKEAAAQEGFNGGFQDSVFIGYQWGIIRGITSAMTSLPGGLLEKLVDNEETRKELHRLHKSVLSLPLPSDAPNLIDPSKSSGSNSDLHHNSSVVESYSSQLQSLLKGSPLEESFKV